ncbi:PREDICTED: uncharacterized protein LOC109580379 [Amphimedon queenslandica]|uniref:Uncharacterized protein n=1 Tax=Amphimedon queenslandica TaxID=400682 RepID=A0A1X7VI59_AMPQE|nr:PREDICTED: uncharacterized protein LOC109580379 [Amphimedon queenslandica]|eukprot:XP_019849006.1 PREDICTED: uncharacterized protein LOC109580379 [Amphimedon queenslandica]
MSAESSPPTITTSSPPPDLHDSEHHSPPNNGFSLYHLLSIDDQNGHSSEPYLIWCVYGLVTLLSLWLLILCAWCRYRHIISELFLNDDREESPSSSTTMEQLQFPLISSTSDTRTKSDEKEYFALSPETAKIEKATRRKKLN